MAELRRGWAAQPRVFGLRSFMEPGCVKIDPAGPFRLNVRTFLSEFAAEQSFAIDGMATWVTFLSDEKSGRVFSLYTVEDQVRNSPHPFCDYCRSTGWSHHFVSKRKYHLIIPAESNCDGSKPLDDDSFLDSETHLLHGLIHCNGYGHLLALNGYEHGSKPLRGQDLLDLFDRICSALCVKEVTVEDESKMKKMELPLLHAVAYGRTWFGKWGYKLRHGSYGITPSRYQQAIKVLSSITLDKLVEDFGKVGRDRGLKRIISTYQSSSPANTAPLVTLGDLLRRMLDLKALLPFDANVRFKVQPAPPAPERVTPAVIKVKTATVGKGKMFKDVAKKLDSRWSVRRMEHAAEVVVEALRQGQERRKGMTRQDVRDAARLEIGDTGLIDFVLKSIGGCVVGSDLVRRTINPTTRTLEFSLQDAGCGKPSPVHSLLTPPTPAVEEPLLKETFISRRDEVEKDVWYVYRQVFDEYPPEVEDAAGIEVAVGVIRDCKHFSKSWPFVDNAADDNLRYHCGVIADAADLEFLHHGVPACELVVLPHYATVGDLMRAAEAAFRDTYFVMDRFTATSVDGIPSPEPATMDYYWDAYLYKDQSREMVYEVVGSGGAVWLRGTGWDRATELQYEGGADNWTVKCKCGAVDDDGESMVACDVCEVWQHTRCAGFPDGESPPKAYWCETCSMVLDPRRFASPGMFVVDTCAAAESRQLASDGAYRRPTALFF